MEILSSQLFRDRVNQKILFGQKFIPLYTEANCRFHIVVDDIYAGEVVKCPSL